MGPGSRRPPPTQKGSVISAQQVDRPVRPTRPESGLGTGPEPRPQTGPSLAQEWGACPPVYLTTWESRRRRLQVRGRGPPDYAGDTIIPEASNPVLKPSSAPTVFLCPQTHSPREGQEPRLERGSVQEERGAQRPSQGPIATLRCAGPGPWGAFLHSLTQTGDNATLPGWARLDLSLQDTDGRWPRWAKMGTEGS